MTGPCSSPTPPGCCSASYPQISRRLLGVPGTATTERAFKAAYRRVRYCFGAICSVMDPSALPKNRRLTEQDLKARARPMTPGQAQAARGRWKPSSTP